MKVLKILLFITTFSVPTVSAAAEQKLFLEENRLVVAEVVAEYPGVPRGISPEIAHQLITGELAEFTVKADGGRVVHRFSYPLKKETAFSDRKINYQRGKWIEEEVLRRETVENWLSTIIGLIIPGILILIVSLINRLAGIGSRKLIVFYLAMFAGVLAGMSAGAVGIPVGVLVGVYAGGFAGGFAGVCVGGLAGGLASGFASVYAGGEYWIVIQYLALWEVASFAVSWAVAFTKTHLPAVIQWINTD